MGTTDCELAPRKQPQDKTTLSISKLMVSGVCDTDERLTEAFLLGFRAGLLPTVANVISKGDGSFESTCKIGVPHAHFSAIDVRVCPGAWGV
jgi:hypothetical protein